MKVRNLIGIKAVESFQLLPPVFQANFSTASHEGSSKFPVTGFINAVVTLLLDTVRKLLLCVIREMRIHFGMILTVLRDGRLMRTRFGLIL